MVAGAILKPAYLSTTLKPILPKTVFSKKGGLVGGAASWVLPKNDGQIMMWTNLLLRQITENDTMGPTPPIHKREPGAALGMLMPPVPPIMPLVAIPTNTE